MSNDIECIMAHLQARFPGQISGLHPCWDECAWSRVYRVVLYDGTHLFLKGTPRSRNEALITQLLHALFPASIPDVIDTDFIPEANWRWFLLEDAGYCDEEALSPATAREAAYILGVLQRRAMNESPLLSLVVHCEGDHLRERAVDVCIWAIEHAPMTTRKNIEHITLNIGQASSFFREVADQLQDVPATIVHGDLWAGNIAVAPADRTVRLIDWGDAMWGVGGISIVHLLLTAQGMLDESSLAIWDAYGSGLGMHVKPGYKEACAVANLVTGLVTDMEIASCCGHGLEILPGLLPLLCSLEAQALGHSSLL